MKYLLPNMILLLLFSMMLSLTSGGLYAQRSVAELISVMPPPKDRVEYKDGVRQINILNDHLFVTNFWAGLQVVDISDIKNPRQTAFLPSDDEAYYTHIDGKYAYMANHSTGVQVYDIENLDRVSHAATIKPPGNTYWVVAEYPTLIAALGDSGFAIMDVSDLQNPALIKHVQPGPWIQQVFKKDNLLFLAAKTDGVLIYDISDLANPRKLSQFRTRYNTMMIQVIDNTAFVADGPGGLVMLNIENPEFPVLTQRFANIGFVTNLFKAGSYVYLANRDVGLQIVNISDPAKPFLESVYDTEDISYGVFKRDIYVFLAANTESLIMRHNNAPLLENIDDLNLQENVPFSLQLKAEEPDGDLIEYEALNLPEGATFDTGTGYFAWMPTFEQSGRYPQVIFRVIEQTDTRLTASDTVTIHVQHINRLPDLPALSNMEVAENTPLTFTVPQGSDPDVEDQARLAYRAEKMPEGAAFDPASRTFSWTPTFEQSGTYILDFLIDDGAGGIDREPVTVTVDHVDRKPVIDAVAAQTIDEAQEIRFSVTGTELDREDQNQISFRMENLPPGAAFDAVTQTFNWTPTYDQSGLYNNLRAVMIAGKLSDTTMISIQVNHVNRPPVLALVPDQTVAENQLLSFVINGSDPDVEDAGKLTYTAENLPEGASFDPVTRTFSWTPTFEQSGLYPGVTFTVTDPSGLSDSKQIQITGTHVNRAPDILAIDNQQCAENSLLSFQLSATDPDAEDSGRLVFSAAGLPEGAVLNPASGLFEWTPTFDQSGEYSLTFSISDGEYSDQIPVTISVAHVNRPPVLDAVAPQTVAENQALRFTVSGSDPDVEDAGKLVFSAQNLPAGALFDPAARSFAWTPTFEQSGQYEVGFTISDPSGLSDSKPALISVAHVNRTPALAAVEAQTVDENQLLTVQLTGSDPDGEDAGKLVYSVNNLPAGATIDPAAGVIRWTPSFEQSGSYTLNAQVADPDGLTAPQSVTVTVNHVNRPPAFDALAPVAGSENAPLVFTAGAGDPDQEDAGKLIYSATGLPAGAVLNPASGEVSWTPTFEQSGEYAVSFLVTDSYGATDALTVPVVIAHVNRTPELPAVAGGQFQENTPGTVTVPEASDPDVEDAGKLAYRVEGLPAGATFDPASRTLSWTPTFEQSGEYQLTAVVADPDGLSAAQPFSISVAHVNRPPAFAPLPLQEGRENSPLVFTLPGSDADVEDAGKLRYSAVNLPAGAALDPASGQFSWTPGFEQSGDYQVSFEITDSFGERAATTVDIRIAHTNRAPLMADLPVYNFTENTPATVTLPEGSDPDIEDAGKLAYSLEGLPNGASFTGGSRTFSWTPGFEQAGDYQMTLVVSDPEGLSAAGRLRLTVENVNRPPQLSAPGDQDGQENQQLSFSLQGSDPDPEDSGNLVYRCSNLPPGAFLDASSGRFGWTPGFDQSGSYRLSFTVSDLAGASAAAEIGITVANTNRPPQLASPGSQTVREGETLRFTVSASDPDAEDAGRLTLSAGSRPDGSQFDSNSGEFSWTPNREQQGSYSVEFTVNDGSGESSRVSVSIEVQDVPDQPAPPGEGEGGN